MSFNSIQTGVIRTITTNAAYSCSTVFADDYRALGAGNLRFVAISLGGFSNEDFTFQKVANQWLVNLDIYTIRTGEISVAKNNAQVNMQTIVDTLDIYPFLNDTTGVTDHNVVSISPISFNDPISGSRNAYLHQQLGLAVTELCTITRSEPV